MCLSNKKSQFFWNLESRKKSKKKKEEVISGVQMMSHAERSGLVSWGRGQCARGVPLEPTEKG